MSAELVTTILVVGGGIVVQLLINRQNRQGQQATANLETKKIELDGKRVDLNVLTESITNLRERLSDVEERFEHSEDQRKLSNTYARTMTEVLRQNGIPVPPPPAGLDFP